MPGDSMCRCGEFSSSLLSLFDLLLLFFVTSFTGQYPCVGYMRLVWSSNEFRNVRSWSKKFTVKICVAWSLIHSHPGMTSTKRSGSSTISRISDLMWAGMSDSNSWQWEARKGHCKMKWEGSSGLEWHMQFAGRVTRFHARTIASV